MAEKDINIHVKAKTDEAQQHLKETAASVKQVGDAAQQSGQKTKQGAEQGTQATERLGESAIKTTGLFERFFAKIAGIFSVITVINTVTEAIRKQGQALDENAEKTNKYQNALLRLQFLGEFFKEKPTLRQEVAAMAEFGRRPFEEVANAWYNLRSKNAALPQQQQESILKEALEMGRTDPSLPLDTLVDMFSLYAKKSGTTDANRIQNVLQQTITEAGGSGADVASYMPRFLPIGMAGGLTGAQAAGLWAYATTQEGEASIATTGLRSVFLGLEGKGTPVGAKLLKDLGVDTQGDFFTKITQLSQAKAAGKLGLPEAEQIAQREGASILLSILNDPRGLMRTVGNVTKADRSDIDLTRDNLVGLLGQDALAKGEEDRRLMEIAIENIRSQDLRAQQAVLRRRQIEYINRSTGGSEYAIQLSNTIDWAAAAVGLEPEPIDPNTLQRLKAKGLLPAELSPTIINNNNVVYNSPEAAAKPRSSPEDLP